MKLDDFNYHLPEARIALRPVSPRPASKLLVSEARTLSDSHVFDLPNFLRPGDLLVFNDTKVLPARLSGTRTRQTDHGSGIAKIEVTLLEQGADGSWLALSKPTKRLRAGDVICFSDDFEAELLEKTLEGPVRLGFEMDEPDLLLQLEKHGSMPLPPYIASKRQTDAQDKQDYQSVFASNPGAVAAPTASLHFDQGLLDRLAQSGVQSVHITLHVGAGTFLPVKVSDISKHKMHSEWGEITPEAAALINQTKANGGRIIPVGTTALRLLESAAIAPGKLAPWRGSTDIFISPGFEFCISDGLMTNFHLPKSTLLMLVSALVGTDEIKRIYAHAINDDYRFFSYGDASLLLP